MTSGLKPTHLERYKDVGMLLLKFGQTDLLEKVGLREFLSTNPSKPDKMQRVRDAGELVSEIERLGPAFIAVGQVLSNRADILPVPYLDALATVGANEAIVLPYAQIKEIITAELATSIKDFRSIEEQPFEISSLSQSHRAIMKTGKQVIVKIQRPGVREKIIDDLLALEEVAYFCDSHTKTGKNLDLAASFEEIRKLILSKLDYQQVVSNLAILKRNLSEFDALVVPTIVRECSSAEVLTSEFLPARTLAEIRRTGVLRSERQNLAEQLVYSSFKQLVAEGFFCAGLNRNNITITKSGQLALLSGGPFVKLVSSTREKLVQLFVAIQQGKTEHATDVLISLSKKVDGFDELELRRQVEELTLQQKTAASANRGFGAALVGLCKASSLVGLRITPEIPLLAGAFYNIERSAIELDSRLDTSAYLEPYLDEVARKHLTKAFSPQNLFHNAVEVAELIEKLPAKVSRILDSVAANDLKVKVHAIDEEVLIKGFQKIANRIALALVLAALIMGAALLMQVKTSFSIWGYPGLAMICFIGAAIFGFTLVVEIMVSDRH